MAQWPDADELKQLVDVESNDLDDFFDRILAAARQQVLEDIGKAFDYEYEPDDKVAAAALRMGELMAERGEATPGIVKDDPTYLRLLKGRRRVFSHA
jgi:hypothetical protein